MLPLDIQRCGGRNRGKGFVPCDVRNTCARFTQLAKDAAGGITSPTPTMFTCRSGADALTPLYIHDPRPPAPPRKPWKGKAKATDESSPPSTRYKKNRVVRERAIRSLNWGK